MWCGIWSQIDLESRPCSAPHRSVTVGKFLFFVSLIFLICQVDHDNTPLSMLKSSRWHTVGPQEMATAEVFVLSLL